MTPEQKAEYLKYLQSSQGMTPEQASAYYDYATGEKTSGTQKVLNKASEAFQSAANSLPGKVALGLLDYPRSLVVGTGNSMLQKGKAYVKGLQMLPSDPVEGLKTMATAPFQGYGELVEGVTGRAPMTSQILKKEGVPELGSVSGGLSNVRQGLRTAGLPGAAEYVPDVEKGSLLDLTGRGTVGFAGDTLASIAGGKAIAQGLQMVAEPMYKSAFSRKDEVAKQFGKGKLPSQVAWENRDKIAGSESQIKEGVKQVLDEKLAERQGLINAVEASGSEANLPRAAAETREMIDQWRTPGREGGNLAKAKAAESFQKGLDDTMEFAMPKEPTSLYGEVYTPNSQTAGTKVILRKKPEVMLTPEMPKGSVQQIGEVPTGKMVPTTPVDVPVEVQKGLGMLPSEVSLKKQFLDMVPETTPVEGFVTPEATQKAATGLKIVEKRIPEVAKVERVPGVGIQGAMDLKTTAYGDISDDAWREFAKTPEGAALTRKWAQGLRQETEQLAEDYMPGWGQKLASQNEDIGALLTTSDEFSRDALKQAGRPTITQIDAMALAADPTLAAAKNAARIARLPWFATKGGRFLYDTAAPMTKAASKLAPVLNLMDEASKQQLILDMQK